ncbi:hypothetical protein BT93_L3390 [Corymbia citriodora subsp. variegata]|uniref:Secreted protein n=1 Tax=Corymbia citriodora subsp. variegata TaxID=360336 RepID=A0A8T0CJU8_CORYI|nr:hypothetical protein BT93_L3390 [Corymbia citriodora subsp. variegata]
MPLLPFVVLRYLWQLSSSLESGPQYVAENSPAHFASYLCEESDIGSLIVPIMQRPVPHCLVMDFVIAGVKSQCDELRCPKRNALLVWELWSLFHGIFQ